MKSVGLVFGDFKLQIEVLTHDIEGAGGPYLDWLRCDVKASTPSFSGQFRWSVMPGELSRLADNLISLYDAFPERGSVTFEPLEPNVSLSFCISTTGAVKGTFSVREDFVTGDELRGRFTMEQSMLPNLAKSIRAIAKENEALA